MPAIRIMALQPFMPFKQPLSSAEENFKHYQYRQAVMKKLYGLLNDALAVLAVKDNVRYVDARFIYNDLPHTIFSDDVHFVNDEGYRILAERIVSAVNEKDFMN